MSRTEMTSSSLANLYGSNESGLTNVYSPKNNRSDNNNVPPQDVDESNYVDSDSIVSKRITIAGGFLDLALFSANVEHLKFVIETGSVWMKHYDLLLGLLITSLVLQLITGALLFMSGFKKTQHITKTQAHIGSILQQMIIGLVTAIAIVNVCFTFSVQ